MSKYKKTLKHQDVNKEEGGLGKDAKTLKRLSAKKIRTTVYFPETECRMLNEIYTRRLLSNQKTDKSSLICEAIRLLYQDEDQA